MVVDLVQYNLLFEWFISEECKELFDIDVDFEYECCEEVIQYIYGKYGWDCVGFCVMVIYYCLCFVICEVGKVMGLFEDVISVLVKIIWGLWGIEVGEVYVCEVGFDFYDLFLWCMMIVV